MPHVVVIGAGITGVTSAYELIKLGYQVTVIDRHLFPAMETSFANGGNYLRVMLKFGIKRQQCSRVSNG